MTKYLKNAKPEKDPFKKLEKKMDASFLMLEREMNLRSKDMRQRFEKIDRRFEAIDQRFERLEEAMIELRRDVLSAMEGVMGELKDFREEMTILSTQHGRINSLEIKVSGLEKIHPQGQHSAAI